MKTKRIDLLIVLVLFANLMAAQNGYSLKFEDAFFMSVENPTSHSGSTAEVTRTFIVPAGCILEINSGCVEYVEANNISSTTLKIGNEYLTKLENNKNWQPILVKEGTSVTLSKKPILNRQCLCGYVAGTLYRKVPN